MFNRSFYRRLALSLGLVVGFAAIAVPAGAQPLVLRDSFSNDTVGQVPNQPEIGSAWYYDAATTHRVIAPTTGEKALASTDSSTSNGFAIEYIPTSTPAQAEIAYAFQIENGAALSSLNSFKQTVLLGGGIDFSLMWGSGGSFATQLDIPGEPSEAFVTEWIWSTGVVYNVLIAADTVNNTVDAYIDGQQMIHQLIPSAASGVLGLHFQSNFTTTGTQVIDEVVITPEPASLALLGLGGLALVRRRRA